MKHILDNPVWSALCSGNSQLANGNELVKYFDPAVSPFVAASANTPSNLVLLRDVIPFEKPVMLVSDTKLSIPDCWQVLQRVDGVQMLYDQHVGSGEDRAVIKPLTEEHIPQMLALTKLTKPGPFAERTIEFGHYRGIFDEDNLVAMAGQRLYAFEFAEISAVCTHPDYLGRGYARLLLVDQLQRILEASEKPYLHVRTDNVRALQLYEMLGFTIRTEIFFYVLQKK